MTDNWYRHYKGGIYRVLMEGLDTEEEVVKVVYENQDGEVFIRPKEMFYENLPDGTPRFKRTRDPNEPRWREIPGWCVDGLGWQLSDCGKIRNTSDGDETLNDFDEVVDVQFEILSDFDLSCIHLYGGVDGVWTEGFFGFSEIKKAVSEGRPPIGKIVEYPESD